MTDKLILSLFKCLKKNYPENVPMPLRHETKMPMYPHKNGKWSWHDVEKAGFGSCIGILLQTIVVLDFDDSETAEEWESRFPILNSVPMEYTKKGRHYFFKRNIECDAFALYDKSRFMGADGPEIDFKTVCSTGTAGLICVTPSVNKRWERTLWDCNLQPMNEDLMMYIVNNWDRKNKAVKVEKKIYQYQPIPEEKIDTIHLDLIERNFSVACFKLLNSTRSKDYDLWIRAGWCGRNISASDLDFQKDMMDSWLDFSAKCPEKHDVNRSTQIWNSIIPRGNKAGLGLGSLKRWGEEDSYDEFRKLTFQSYSYEAYKEIFEQEYVKVLNPVIFVQKRNNTMYYKSRKELIDTWEHVEYKEDDGKNGIRSKSFINRWLRDKSIPIYETMDNLPPPLECPNNCYNLWLGFPHDEHDCAVSDISPMINHIDHLVNNHPASREYLIDWLAHIVQYPGLLNNIAIALVGPEGVGKNIFTSFLTNMVGNNLAGQTDNPQVDIFEKFANGPQGKLIYVIDEAKGRDGYRYDNRIKNMITAQTVRLEKKGRDTVHVRNTARYMFTSNDSYILNVSPGDRRFVIFRTDQSRPDKSYFDRLRQFVNNKISIRSFYEFLKNRDVSGKDWIDSRPLTDIYLENRAVSLPMEIKYFIHLHNTLPEDEQHKKITREEFIDFAHQKEEAAGFTISATKFGIMVSKIDFIESKKPAGPTVYTIDLTKMKLFLTKKKYIGCVV